MKRSFTVFIVFLISFSLFAAEEVFLPDLTNPGQLLVDPIGGNIYIADGTTIFIHSLKDFKLKKKFGRNGEGPKEFKRRVRLTLSGKLLLVNSVARVTFFTNEGEYIREMNAKTANLGPFLPIGKNYVNTSMDRSEKVLKYTLNLYDSNLDKLKTFGYLTRNEQRGKKRILALDWGFPKYHVYKDRIYCEENDNELFVFDGDGNKLHRWDVHSLIPGYKKVKVSEAYKEEFLKVLKIRAGAEYERVKSQLYFPVHYTIIRDFMVSDNSIFVITFVKKGDKQEVHQFDLEGKFIRTFFQEHIELSPFQFYPMDIKDGKLYQLYDGDDDWALRITELN